MNSELDRKELIALAEKSGFVLNPVGQLVVPAPHDDATPYLRRFLKLALSTEAQPEGYFYETYSGSKGHFLGAIHDNTKWRVDHEDLKLTPFWLSAPQPPAITEAQPEVTGAVAYLDYNGVLKPTRDGVITMKKGDNLYPRSAIEAAVREKLEAVKERDRLGYAVVKLVEAVDALLEAGSDEYLHDESGDFTYEEAPSDYWADLRTAADNMVLRAEDFEEKYRALMESPHTSVEEPAN